MSKSIFIDATHLAAPKPTGVEIYAERLLPKLTEKLLHKGYEVTWIGHSLTLPPGMPHDARWLPSPHRRFWGQRELARILKAHRPDLFFTPSGIPPLLYGGRTAMTVHDLAAYEEPESFTPGQLLRLRLITRKAARKASLLLVPSVYTREAAIKHWRLDSSLVKVVPHGFDPGQEVSPEPVPGIAEDQAVMLFIGRIEWKKNLLPVVSGFLQLAQEQPHYVLVLAGNFGYGAPEVRRAVASLPDGIRERVVMPGYVTDGQKRWLYERAAMTVVPCRTEGFGIPVLEAFHYGVPVICAQSGSLPEVGQNGSFYAQPDIATDWYLQARRIIEDEPEARSRVKNGQRIVSSMTWEAAAESTAEALIAACR